MTSEQKAKYFDDIIYSDCFDDLVSYRLKRSLKYSMDDLEAFYKQEIWGDETWQYFSETIKYCRSIIFVLEYFSLEDFTEEMVQVNKYSLKLEEVY
jgi:hypothetical protein